MKPTPTVKPASDHLFATCAPPLTLPLADILLSAVPRPPGCRRPAFLSREGARTAARAAVAPGLPLVPDRWEPRKAIAAARELLLGEDGQPPPPAPRRFKVPTPFPLAGYLENPDHQRTVRRRSLGAMFAWPLLAAALLGLGGAGTEARAQSTLSGSGLNVNFSNGSGGISALQYNGSEFYRLGTFISDWGLQTGTNTSTFVLNSAIGTTGQPMTLLSATPSTVTFTGTYSAGGANVALTRSYTLLAGGPVLRTSFTLQNLSGVAVDLRSFETYDIDGGGSSATYNDRLLVGGELAGQAVRLDGYAAVIGSADPATIVSASDRFGIGSGATLNAFFGNGGTDSNGALADLTTDIGFDLPLLPGAIRTVVYDQAYGTTAAAAQTAFFGAPVTPTVPEPSTWAMALGGLGVLLLLQRRRRTTPAIPRAGAGSLLAGAGFVLMLGGALPARAVVDQQQTNSNGFTGTFTTPAQSFVPTLSALDFVELGVEDQNAGNAIGASLFVQIRAGGITGTIIGTSQTLTLADGFGAPVGSGLTPALFPFATPVTLVPGTPYVLQLQKSSGDTFQVNISGSDNYAGGTAFYNGVANASQDLYFREGFGTVPEPSAWALAAVGLAGLTGVVRRRAWHRAA